MAQIFTPFAAASPPEPGQPSPAAGFEAPFDMLAACHDRVRRSLDLLHRLVAHVQQHGADAQAADAARDVWRYFTIAAPAHHQDEERHVLPRLRASGEAPLIAAAQQIEEDHRAFAALWTPLALLLEALQQRRLPDVAALQAAAEAFTGLHVRHLELEDGLAFAAAARRSSPAEQAAMGAEMAARRGVVRRDPI